MCFPRWNSALHHVQKVTPTLNAHGTPKSNRKTPWNASCTIPQNWNLQLFLDRDSWGFAIVKRHNCFLQGWSCIFSLPKIWFWSEPLGSLACRGQESCAAILVQNCWFDDFLLDYGTEGFGFCRFCFLNFMLCIANVKVTFMLNFSDPGWQTKWDYNILIYFYYLKTLWKTLESIGYFEQSTSAKPRTAFST